MDFKYPRLQHYEPGARRSTSPRTVPVFDPPRGDVCCRCSWCCVFCCLALLVLVAGSVALVLWPLWPSAPRVIVEGMRVDDRGKIASGTGSVSLRWNVGLLVQNNNAFQVELEVAAVQALLVGTDALLAQGKWDGETEPAIVVARRDQRTVAVAMDMAMGERSVVEARRACEKAHALAVVLRVAVTTWGGLRRRTATVSRPIVLDCAPLLDSLQQ
jgi:hypothetical protein